jgi:hypothetical protein
VLLAPDGIRSVRVLHQAVYTVAHLGLVVVRLHDIWNTSVGRLEGRTAVNGTEYTDGRDAHPHALTGREHMVSAQPAASRKPAVPATVVIDSRNGVPAQATISRAEQSCLIDPGPHHAVIGVEGPYLVQLAPALFVECRAIHDLLPGEQVRAALDGSPEPP